MSRLQDGRLRFAHRRWSGCAPSRCASRPFGDHQLSQGRRAVRNHYGIGPIIVRIGSKHLAPWGFPRVQIGGLSLWSWTNSGDLLLAAYHPRRSITWLWSIGIGRQKGRFGRAALQHRRELHASGNPYAPAPRWWDRFLCLDGMRRSQWHDHLRLPFGFVLRISRQEAMWRKPKVKPTGEFLPDWRERVARDQCPVCPGELDTGWECNDCGFDARLIARTEGARPHA
jgi:hypothetical protein